MDVLSYLPVIDNSFQDTPTSTLTATTDPPECTETNNITCTKYQLINTNSDRYKTVQYKNCAGVTTTYELFPLQIIQLDANSYGLTTDSSDPNYNGDEAFTVTNGGNSTAGEQQGITISVLGISSYAGSFTGDACDSQPLANKFKDL